jgi:hypothetical protein
MYTCTLQCTTIAWKMQGTCSTFTFEAVYLYCLRHEWRESVCLKGKYTRKILLCISKKLVRRSLLFTMLILQQISQVKWKTLNKI